MADESENLSREQLEALRRGIPPNDWCMGAGRGWPKAWCEVFGEEIPDADIGWPVYDSVTGELVAIAVDPKIQTWIALSPQGTRRLLREIDRKVAGGDR